MDILDDMEVNKLSAKFFFKVNYSFKPQCSFALYAISLQSWRNNGGIKEISL